MADKRPFGHIARALHERAWAIQPSMLALMAELVDFRVAGGVLTAEDITERLDNAAARNGPRQGAAPSSSPAPFGEMSQQVGSVVVIPIYGVISQRMSLMTEMSGGTSIDSLRADFRQALADPSVSAVVFDIDSPGGSTDGLPEFAAEVRGARGGTKAIAGQVNTLAASAAYWLAAQMGEVTVTPSGEVGSIGVFSLHEDLSKAAEMEGVKYTFISAGPYKVDGNQFEPLSDTAAAAMQEQVDTFYSMFLADVAKGRGVTATRVASDYGQGRTLLAGRALEAGMVDRIGTLEETIARHQAASSTSARARAAADLTPIARAAGTADPAWNARMKGLLHR